MKKRCNSVKRGSTGNLKISDKQDSKKNLALRVSLVTFTPDEVDLLLEVIGLLAQVGNDPRSGASMPLIREVSRKTAEMQQKLHAIKDRLGETVTFDNSDYMMLYTATMLFSQVNLLMPVLLPPSLSASGLAQRVQALEAKLVSSLPQDEKKR